MEYSSTTRVPILKYSYSHLYSRPSVLVLVLVLEGLSTRYSRKNSDEYPSTLMSLIFIGYNLDHAENACYESKKAEIVQ